MSVTTPSFIIETNEISPVITVQTQNISGSPVDVDVLTTIDLSSTSTGGEFSTAPDFGTMVSSVQIPAGENSATFYYRDSEVGNPTITASESPDQDWTDANQTVTIIPPFVISSDILLVDDDAGSSYESYYGSALTSNSLAYDLWDVSVRGEVPSSILNGYQGEQKCVIWFTGDDWSYTLTATERMNLSSFLQGGRRLFITGQDIGYYLHYEDPDITWYETYLYAHFITDGVDLYTLSGASGDPIGEGLSIGIAGGDGASNQNYPGEIDPISPAVTVFTYETGGGMVLVERPDREREEGSLRQPDADRDAVVAKTSSQEREGSDRGIGSSGTGGLRVDTGTYRLVYFAFGFEAIASANDRETVMDRIVDWLTSQQISVTVTTSIGSGTTVVVDGDTVSTPYNAAWIAGSQHTIGIASPQSGGTNKQYVYQSWSDGGAQTHSVAPTTDMIYTANMLTQWQPAITLNGTDIDHTVSTEAHTEDGLPHLESGLYGPWSDWCDNGTTLTFSESTTGMPTRTTVDSRSWPTVNSAFSATINYYAAPSVTAIDPNTGVNNTTIDVTITGSNFVATPTMQIGTTSCVDVVWVSATSVTGTVPSGIAQGVYAVMVTNPDGQSGSLADGFEVILPADIALSADAHDFGSVVVGDSLDWVLAVRNVGGVDLTVYDIHWDEVVFTLSDTSGVISGGDSLEVTVWFKPVAGVSYEDSLVVVSDDVDEDTVYVALSGVGDAPPAAPTGLVAMAYADLVRLRWNANTEPDLHAYYIYRDTSPSPTVLLDSVVATSPPDTFYTDVNVVNATTYYYRITAVDSAGNVSDYSNEVGASPLVSYVNPPVDLAAKSGHDGYVPLTWNPPSIMDEGFEAGVMPPSGWTKIDGPSSPGNEPAHWRITEYGHSGNYEALCPWGYNLDEWLVSPELDFSSVTSPSLSFWWQSSYYWHVDPYDHGDLFVKISTDEGATWSSPLWTFGDIGVWESWRWYQTTLDLSAYSGQSSVRIAFHVLSDDNADIAIDDIVVGDTQTKGKGSVLLAAGKREDVGYPPDAKSIAELTVAKPAVGVQDVQFASSVRAVSSYNVYRSTDPSVSLDQWSQIASGVPDTLYNDDSVTNGQTYWYYVTAVYEDPSGESDPSDISGATPSASDGVTHYRAVIVGIADYEHISDLNYTDDDALDMRDALVASPWWRDGDIQLLIDAQASKSGIQAAIAAMGDQSDGDDVCLFFFSGHGTNGLDVFPYDESDGLDEYLCCYDMTTTSTAIRDDELDFWLSSLPTNNVAVIVDICYSGGVIT